MATVFMVNGEEKTLVMRDERGIDWSADFIGNTAHGMQTDEEGRYIATQEDYAWWQDTIAKHEHLAEVIAEYKDRFDRDDVDQVVRDWENAGDLEYLPGLIIDALKEAFGKL